MTTTPPHMGLASLILVWHPAHMSDRNPKSVGGLKLVLPFLVGDALLLGAAYLIFWQGHRPMTPVEVIALAACTALGAWLGAWPFVLLHRAELALAEADLLTDTVAQIQQIETVANRISTATGQWQTAQDHSSRVVAAAREIADRMDRETRDFLTFFEKADTTEKNHLRLENEKLRRGEADWLQVLVRILDHIFALQQAASRSAQPNVANQIAAFQNACRDAARRIGLVPVTVDPGTPFDPKIHQVFDPNASVPQWPVIAQVVGTGYSFQGQPLRPIVVALKAGAAPEASAAEPSYTSSETALAAPQSEVSAAAKPGAESQLAAAGESPQAPPEKPGL